MTNENHKKILQYSIELMDLSILSSSIREESLKRDVQYRNHDQIRVILYLTIFISILFNFSISAAVPAQSVDNASLMFSNSTIAESISAITPILSATPDLITSGTGQDIITATFSKPVQGSITIGEPVNWTQSIFINNPSDRPASYNISLTRDFPEGFNFTVSYQAATINNSTLVVDVEAGNNTTIELSYQTAPVQMQIETKTIDLTSLIPADAMNVEISKEIGDDNTSLDQETDLQVDLTTITVGHNSSMHYYNIPVSVDIEDNNSIIEIVKGSGIEVPVESSNDTAQWIVPNLSDRTFVTGVQIIQEPAVINEPVGWTLSANGTFIKYTTPAPYLIEKSINSGTKRVTVESTASIHYYNVTAFTDVTEVQQEQIRLFWFDNGTRIDVTHDPLYNLTFTDTDVNGLIDNISWTVPRLSEQVFEVETYLTIINVQSYPTPGGNWTVNFNTTGTADLTITPVNGTDFGEDLEFLELWCGSGQVNAVYNGTSVFYPNWNCSGDGKIVDRVLTTGKHVLEFRFGSDIEYAYNLVDSNLDLTPDNITFVYDPGERADVTETGDAKEGINLTINATIYNQGVSASGSFYVLFYDGNSEFYNVSMLDGIAAGASANATGYWTTLPGTHNITIKVDPYNDTQDSDVSNNNASKLIDVSAWQKYYGTIISGNLALNDVSNNTYYNWDWMSNLGNVYVTDKDCSINWTSLKALGYKTDGVTAATTDFSDIDTNLNLITGYSNATGFSNNNVSELFSSNGETARNTSTFIVYGTTINNIAIVNSTSMTNHAAVGSSSFYTGILWDTSDDSGNGEYDTTDDEDIVFVTKLNIGQTGAVGVCDYEMTVPDRLNYYKSGSDEVEFYIELI